MKIFTYFTPVKGIDLEAELALILLWQRVWRGQGHEPIVLNESHARQHPRYKEAEQKLRTFPTVNEFQYEFNCYVRWLALAALNDGVMLATDFDVFPNSKDALKDAGVIRDAKKLTRLTSYQLHVPSCMLGKAEHFQAFIDYFMSLENPPTQIIDDKPHTSDMIIFGEYKQATQIHVLRDYKEDGAEVAPMIHYSHGSTHPRGMIPRWKHIQPLVEA